MSLASGAFDVFEFDPFSLETNKAPKSLGVTVVLLAFEDGVDHLASHETVIASAVDHFYFTHSVDKFIKDSGAEAANGRLTFAADASSSN